MGFTTLSTGQNSRLGVLSSFRVYGMLLPENI